jgi:hypothetical protein
VTNQGNRTIEQYNGATGAYIGTLVPASGGISDPIDIAIAPDGNLFISGGPPNTDSVLKFNRLNGGSMGVFATGVHGAEEPPLDDGESTWVEPDRAALPAFATQHGRGPRGAVHILREQPQRFADTAPGTVEQDE